MLLCCAFLQPTPRPTQNLNLLILKSLSIGWLNNTMQGPHFLLLKVLNTYFLTLWSEICAKYFLLFPQKTCHQRKLRQTKCLLLKWMIKLTVKSHLSLGNLAKMVHFVILKLRSKLSLSQFSLVRYFLRE